MNVKKSALVIVIAAVLLSSMVGMVSATSQDWYLTSSTTGPGDYQMQKSGSGATETEYVTLAKDVVKVWAADSAALGAIDMQGSWSTHMIINVANPDNSVTVKMELGKLSGTSFTTADSVEETFTGGSYRLWTPTGLDPESFPISSSEYLAIRITNNATQTFSVTIYPNSEETTYITTPASSPVYPVPELSTIMLTCIGMLMLGGFVVYSRRRNNK